LAGRSEMTRVCARRAVNIRTCRRPSIDRAESVMSYFAIILPIIDRDYGGVELEALDNRKIDAVFVQIVGTVAYP
jgi:hypothetical protein